jgi:uncharacterized membrane protein YhhN
MQLQVTLLEKICKPLLVPVLILYFILSLKNQSIRELTKLKTWILLALFFSWAGDVLLMFQQDDPNFFLAGLSSFLFAHIFYIIFFHKLRVFENIPAKPLFLVLLVIYYGALVWWLNPYLGDMKLPVRIYGIVISFMCMLALHMLFLRNRTAGRYMMLGAVLFVVSDSLLAINKFYSSFELAGVLIMLTYGMAQLLIVTGAINYIRKQISP